MTRFACSASPLVNNSGSARGTICHDTPKLSVSQPQRPLGAAFGQPLPIVVDLGLIVAIDDQRNRWRERELRAAVEAEELWPSIVEQDGHDGAVGARLAGAVARDPFDARVVEDRAIMRDRLLRR